MDLSLDQEVVVQSLIPATFNRVTIIILPNAFAIKTIIKEFQNSRDAWAQNKI